MSTASGYPVDANGIASFDRLVAQTMRSRPPLPRPQGLLDREQRHLPPRSRVCSSERGTAVGVGQIRGETKPQLTLRRGRTNSLLRLDDTSRRKTTSAGEKRTL